MRNILEPFDGYELEPEDITTASFDAIKAIADNHAYTCFVWPNDEPEFEPLLVDALTANAIITVYNALTEGKPKLERMIAKSRCNFVKIVDFCWNQVSF